MGLTDGLGYEEIGQTQEQTASLRLTGSINAGGIISGLNVFAQGSGTFGRITNANGALLPISDGSPSTYGLSIQVGTAETAAGIGEILFGRPFANATYRISLTPGSTASAEGVQGVLGSMQPVISGLKVTSGLVFFGGPTQPYDYVAV